MILLISLLLGLAVGFLRARAAGRQLHSVEMKNTWLVFLGYLPQFFAFFLPATRSRFPDAWIPAVLIGSQLLLIVFVMSNLKLPGFWMLGLGLVSNFLAIVLNGGMMPLPLENALRLIEPGSGIKLEPGDRAGYGKDIVLLKEDTRLWFLGDIFILPEWLNYPLAFSIGDIFIGMGAFWLLWELGGPRNLNQEVSP